jgi:hypothetical protein
MKRHFKTKQRKTGRVISCNEMPLKKKITILNGIITISTDLYVMDEKQLNPLPSKKSTQSVVAPVHSNHQRIFYQHLHYPGANFSLKHGLNSYAISSGLPRCTAPKSYAYSMYFLLVIFLPRKIFQVSQPH